MATNYYDIDSYYNSSSLDSDLDDEEDIVEKDCRRTYPGAISRSIWSVQTPPLPLPLSPGASSNYSSSDSQLCNRFSTELEIYSSSSSSRPDDYCKAYKNFSSKIQRTISTYHFLDPANSRQFVKGKFDLDNSGMVMLQGALINAVANWEEYIVEILKECFIIFIEKGSGCPPSLHALKKRLPTCNTILRKELRQSCQMKPADEIVYDLLWSVNSPAQYNTRANPWVEYFDSYCQATITGAQIVPIFSPTAFNSIDTLFTKLFQITSGANSLSEQLLKIGRFRFKLRLNQDDEIDLQIHSITALKNISRLYYALRCIFAHGHNQKTVTGALKDFPKNVAEFELGNERAAKYYLGLYRRMERYGRDTSISYLTFINMIEFLKRAAFFLMRTLAKWVYDSTETCIWSYKPHSLVLP